MAGDQRKRRNQRKIQILGLGLDGSELDSFDLVGLLDMGLTNATQCLKDYYNWGLFSREKDGRTYKYTITQKGIDRYLWLVGQQRVRITR